MKIPRVYTSIPFSQAKKKKVCVFSDASTEAITAVAYLKSTDAIGQTGVELIFIKTKLAPKHEFNIPRLEICAAVLAVEIAEVISEELNLDLKNMKFFTDSKVVLGYIFNESGTSMFMLIIECNESDAQLRNINGTMFKVISIQLFMVQEPFQLISFLSQNGSLVQHSFHTHRPVDWSRKPLNSFILSWMQNYDLR